MLSVLKTSHGNNANTLFLKVIAADTASVVESSANEVDRQPIGPEATTVESGPIGQNRVWFRPRRNRGITLLKYKEHEVIVSIIKNYFLKSDKYHFLPSP